MVSKLSNSVKVSSPDVVRNVVLVGTSGSGKTTLFERLLRARIADYRGEKDTPERAASLSLASVPSDKAQINLLDAPGHPDYVGDLRAGLRGADAAILVVSAVDGIDQTTVGLWKECERVGLPRYIAITKLDVGRADFEAVLATCQAAFGQNVVPVLMPLHKDEEVIGNISLLNKRVHDYSSGKRISREPTEEELAIIDQYRPDMLESIITEAEDEDLMDRYLEGEEPAVEEVHDNLQKAALGGHFFPVMPVNSLTDFGTEELLRWIENGFPPPNKSAMPAITTPKGEPTDPITCDPEGPLVAEVIRTTSDPYAGRRSIVRIFSGTLRNDDVVHISGHRSPNQEIETADGGHDDNERIGLLSVANGADFSSRTSAIAGEIVMIAKLTKAETSDTISSQDKPALINPWELPHPLLPIAIKAASRNDEDKLGSALARLEVEDTTVRVERTVETDQLILWTMGQAHMDLLLNRLRDKYGINVIQEPVKVPLRETFITTAKGLGRYVKQSGGHGQYAVCEIEIEPLARGAGFEFVDKVVGGAVPRQFIGSVEKGVRAQLKKGTIWGYPMTDIKVTLFDGKAHSVDSSDMAFQTAGSIAVREAASQQVVALLEPIDFVTVTVAEEYLGPVMTDISGRRGQLQGTDSDDEHRAIVKALIPASELTRYSIDLRGLAQGSGHFTRQFHSYELLPTNLAPEPKK